MMTLIDFRTVYEYKTLVLYFKSCRKIASYFKQSSTKHMPVDYIKDTIYNIKEQKTILTVKII